MTGSSDAPDRRENPQGTPQTGPPYPYPYQYQTSPYPGGYPPPPPQPYYGYPRPPLAPKNGLGIASLVLAIIALLSVWSVFAPIILGLIAVVIGFLGHGRVKRGIANNGGVAIAGIVLGALAIIVGLEGRRRRRLHRLHTESRIRPRPAAAVLRTVSTKRPRPVERHVDADTGALGHHRPRRRGMNSSDSST
jgi:hypothetical protein